MKTLYIIHVPGTLAYQVCKNDEELSVPYVPLSELELLQARIKDLENENDKLNKVANAAMKFFVEREKGDVCYCLGPYYSKLQDALSLIDKPKRSL